MARLSDEQIAKAREMDLLTYLKTYEPFELVKISNSEYSTKTHDSLKISNGKWMWWSRKIGGNSALDYLIKVKGIPFREAVFMITGQENSEQKEVKQAASVPPVFSSQNEKKELILPEKCTTNYVVTKYLKNRGIDLEIIEECIAKGLIYEGLPYHNVVFIGKDGDGKVRNACYRSCNLRRIMGEVPGSEKQYSFRLLSGNKGTIHLFEGAIDLLSYATFLKKTGQDYRTFNLISLGGVYVPKNNGTITVPKALERFLADCKDVNGIIFHLDNDEAGRNATKGLMDALRGKYAIADDPPPYGKDMNEYLQMIIRKEKGGSYERK